MEMETKFRVKMLPDRLSVASKSPYAAIEMKKKTHSKLMPNLGDYSEGRELRNHRPQCETLVLGRRFLNLLIPCRVNTLVSYFPAGWFLIFSQSGFLFSPSHEGLVLRVVVSSFAAFAVCPFLCPLLRLFLLQ